MKGILIIIFFNISIGFSQQEPHYTMFWKNYSLFNPANAGADKQHYANVNYRNNWAKLENSPYSVSALYDAKLKKYNSGLGVGFLHESIGLISSSRFYVNYNYQIKISKSSLNIGLGSAYDIMQFKFNWTTPTGVINGDPNLPVGTKQGKFNLNFGVLYKFKKFRLGASLTQLNQTFYNKLNYKKVAHLFVYSQIDLKISDKFNFMPAIYLKTDFVYTSLIINIRFVYDKKYWLGLSYHKNDTFSFQAGFSIFNRFNFAYNLDYSASKLANNFGNSHEISLSFIID